MQEEWRPVVGFEGFYEVSNFGNIKRIATGSGTKGGILRLGDKKSKTSYGELVYKNAVLSKNGKTTTVLVHRVVAQAFLENKSGKKTVNHIDGNPSNNNVSNLEWASASEQEKHKWHVLKHVIRNNRFGKTPHEIKCLETGEIFPSKREACRQKGIDRKHLYSHLRGESSSVKGLHWSEV